MKYILSVSIYALLFLLCSCGEQKVESVTSIAEEPNKPEIILTEETEEPVSAHLSPESSIVPDSIKILGTWISEEDKNWKLILTPEGKCYQYYSEELISTEDFSISNTSPQCNMDVNVDEHSSYLQLTDLDDQNEICYEINGISDKYLSLRVIGQGGVLVFIRK